MPLLAALAQTRIEAESAGDLASRPLRLPGNPVNLPPGWFVTRWMRPITLGGFGLEEEGGSLVAVMLLNAPPGPRWIEFFRARGRYSTFDVAAARARRNQLRIGLSRREDLGDLIQTVERCIEGANLDMEFHAP